MCVLYSSCTKLLASVPCSRANFERFFGRPVPEIHFVNGLINIGVCLIRPDSSLTERGMLMKESHNYRGLNHLQPKYLWN